MAGFGYYDGVDHFQDLKVGDKLAYYRVPKNKNHSNAIDLWLNDDVQLGYIPKEYNEDVYKNIEMS